MWRITCLFLLISIPLQANAKVSYLKRNWSWSNPNSSKAKPIKLKATLLVASPSAVILGTEAEVTTKDGKKKKVPRLRRFQIGSFSDRDLLYIQAFREAHEEGVSRFFEAEKSVTEADRVSLFKRSAQLGNARANHYIATSLALHGEFEEAEEKLKEVRKFYWARLPFQPSFKEALVAATNNYALLRYRQRDSAGAIKELRKLERLDINEYPPALSYNLDVYSILARKPRGSFKSLKRRVHEKTPERWPTPPRVGWYYMTDDGDGSDNFDKICMVCSGKGHLACPQNKCQNGIYHYTIMKTGQKRVGDRIITFQYPQGATKTCPTCKGKARVKCKGCDSSRLRQNGKTTDERFK